MKELQRNLKERLAHLRETKGNNEAYTNGASADLDHAYVQVIGMLGMVRGGAYSKEEAQARIAEYPANYAVNTTITEMCQEAVSCILASEEEHETL